MPLHLELMAPKEYHVNISIVGGGKGGKRVDSIMQVRRYYYYYYDCY